MTTDAVGVDFSVEQHEHGATSVSVETQDTAVAMATAEPSNEVFFTQEVLEMHLDCSTSSIHRGFEAWTWVNVGFIVGFDKIGYSFPRMDAPISDDTETCHM